MHGSLSGRGSFIKRTLPEVPRDSKARNGGGGRTMSELIECEDCDGTGVDFSFTLDPLDQPSGDDCPTCKGKGKFEAQG